MNLREVSVSTATGKFQQHVRVSGVPGIELVADEPRAAGGDDAGLAPHELLLAGLGACTSMTIKMYAERKGWPLERVEVKLRATRDAAFVIQRSIALQGPLDDAQRARLLEIANKCPVHKTLSGEIRIDSTLC